MRHCDGQKLTILTDFFSFSPVLNEQHFFKELYGHGIAQHIRNLRMERAKSLRPMRGLTIAEIAAKCGYADYNYFITVFTREIGCPPAAYRNRLSTKN